MTWCVTVVGGRTGGVLSERGQYSWGPEQRGRGGAGLEAPGEPPARCRGCSRSWLLTLHPLEAGQDPRQGKWVRSALYSTARQEAFHTRLGNCV